jgi:hypothetical protein
MASRLNVSIFNSPPGTLAPLPDKLGGDAAAWPTLAAAAGKGETAFFALLAAKAHYLMLPEPVIGALDVPALSLSEGPLQDPTAGGETNLLVATPPQVEIRIPQQSVRLAQAGYSFGKSTGGPANLQSQDSSAYYHVLSIIYHEMTHAWFYLYDSTVSAILAIATIYKGAVDTQGKPIDNPYSAMTEASAYYVGDRIERWLTALGALDNLTRTTLSSSSSLEIQLQAIQDEYDRPRSVYGIVYQETAPGTGTYYNAVIAAPPLPDALRDVLNTRILDGLPLTKAFNDTPLADVRNALLNP